VIEMTQELAKMLGLKIRKAYVRLKVKYPFFPNAGGEIGTNII